MDQSQGFYLQAGPLAQRWLEQARAPQLPLVLSRLPSLCTPTATSRPPLQTAAYAHLQHSWYIHLVLPRLHSTYIWFCRACTIKCNSDTSFPCACTGTSTKSLLQKHAFFVQVMLPPRQDIGLDAPADRCGAAEAAALHGSERAADGASGEGPGKDPDTLTPGQPSWLRRMSDAVGAPLSSLMSLLSGRIAPLGAGPFSAAAAFGSSAAAPNAAAAALNTATVAAMRRKLVGPNTVRPRLHMWLARVSWARLGWSGNGAFYFSLSLQTVRLGQDFGNSRCVAHRLLRLKSQLHELQMLQAGRFGANVYQIQERVPLQAVSTAGGPRRRSITTHRCTLCAARAATCLTTMGTSTWIASTMSRTWATATRRCNLHSLLDMFVSCDFQRSCALLHPAAAHA